ARLRLRQDHEAVRLLRVGGHLRDELARANADRAGQARLLPDRVFYAARRGLWPLDAGQVEVGLVEAGALDSPHMLVEDDEDVARAGAVELEVGRQEYRLRAEAPRPFGRCRREDAELARLVGGSSDDGARPGAGHHN